MSVRPILLVTITATVLAFGGCATSPRGWAKADGSAGAAADDKAQCEYEAKKATASYHSTPTEKDRKETGGMGAAVADGVVIAEKQIALVNECMQLKGYRKL